MTRALALAAAVLAAMLCAVPAQAIEFQAMTVMNVGGGLSTAQTYVKGDLIRTDLPGGRYQIVDRKAAKMWLVMPEQKAYLQKDLAPNEIPRMDARLGDEVKRMKVGAEEVSGLEAVKYLVLLQRGGQRVRVFQWVAPALGGLPVRTKAADGHWLTEMRKIEIGPVPAELFKLPAGYLEVDKPGVGPLRKPEEQGQAHGPEDGHGHGPDDGHGHGQEKAR